MRKRKSSRGPAPRPPIRARDIQGLKHFRAIRDLLASLHEHKDGANRKLHYDELAALVLLHFYNPVLTGLRAIQQASGLRQVQKKLRLGRASLGSLSESSRVFDAQLLQEVAAELAGHVLDADAPERPPGLDKDLALVAVDGTLLKALPRMAWALWIDKDHHAAKLHVEFDLLRSAPRALAVTQANGNERDVLRHALEAGKLYALDAGYAEYNLLERIRQAGSSFVARLRDNAVYETQQERPLTGADREAGVLWDRRVRLGCSTKRGDLAGPVRVVAVHVKLPPRGNLARRPSRVSSKKTFRRRPEEMDLLLVTDRMDLAAQDVALLYRRRWLIELFFRWFKCTLRFGRLLFESPNGVEILVYCALIASMVISLWTGRKPTKRTLEMVQLYFQGWAELDELEAHIASLEKAVA
jgi:hypothetical protein